MSLSKFSGDNLAEDLMKPEVWRKTFRFLSIMELVKLREACKTFKDEVDFLFGTQIKLGIFNPSRGPVHPDVSSDSLYYVPNSSWIRLDGLRQHLPILKSLFPSLKVLVMNSSETSLNSRVDYKLYMDEILDLFVNLESLAIDEDIECCDTNRSYPKLKHLFLGSVFEAKLPFLPSLESLRMACDFEKFKSWMEKNFGLPSKRCEIDYPFSGDPDYSFQCLSSLPSSLEYLKTDNFFGYKRQFKPLFPRLKEVSRDYVQVHRDDNINEYGHTEFIDFLKDHSMTLTKVTTNLFSINDEQLRDMLSCLEYGTHITILALQGLQRVDYVRQYGLIGGLCRDRNLYLEIEQYIFLQNLEERNGFLNILPRETQSLTLYVSHMTHNESSCRRLILEIVASPLRSTALIFNPTEEAKRTWSTAIQGLPETHEVILEYFKPKPKRVIIRRRNLRS